MGRGNEVRGYSYLKILIKGYGRENRLGYTVLDNRLTDGCETVSLTSQLPLTPEP
jgi:hypothetical protein